MSSCLRPTALRCGHRATPLALSDGNPFFGWAVTGAGSDRWQRAWRIVVGRDRAAIEQGSGDLWDSGRVENGETLCAAYAGSPLESRMRCWWAVCIWDEQGRAAWSEPASFETGLLGAKDWRKSTWIGGPFPARRPGGSVMTLNAIGGVPPACLRRAFDVPDDMVRARLYASARGVYRAWINGDPASDHILAPAWTDYHKRVEYQCSDVTALLRPGRSAIGVVLGDGWYAGFGGALPRRRGAHWGLRPFFRAQLEIERADGSRSIVATDATWSAATGPLIWSDLLMGERREEASEHRDSSDATFDDGAWEPAEVGHDPGIALVAERGPPIRVLERRAARSVRDMGNGRYVFDFGQNLAGIVRLSGQGSAGDEITLRHAEALAEDGEIYTDNLRSAAATDVVVPARDGPLDYQPTFTTHGFRYVEASGLAAPPEATAATALAIGSDCEPTGVFACSEPLLERIHANICKSGRSNRMGIPTDCPQRDERLGWLADAQVFAATASYTNDCAAFWDKWLVDLADAQLSTGAYGDVAPSPLKELPAAPGWGEAGVLIAHRLWKTYGDHVALRRHWSSMARWMDFCAAGQDGYIRTGGLGMNFGDWLALDEGTPRPLVATAYWALAADRMAEMAAALGKPDAHSHYAARGASIRSAFAREFVGADGRISGETQGSYLLALGFDLVPSAQRAAAGERLAAAIRRAEGHLLCGFLSINRAGPVLYEIGRPDLALAALLKTDYPSLGFEIEAGATTIWERWDGWRPEQGFQGAMNSFNHVAFGSVGEFLYSHIAGCDQTERSVAWSEPLFRPGFPGLGAASARLDTRRGRVSHAWRREGAMVEVDIDLPPNVRAELHLPADSTDVRSDEDTVAGQSALKTLPAKNGLRRFSIGSGKRTVRYREADR